MIDHKQGTPIGAVVFWILVAAFAAGTYKLLA